MGCCSSTFPNNAAISPSAELRASVEDIYLPAPRLLTAVGPLGGSKRSFTSRLSSPSSSGVFSRCTTPSSQRSRSSTPSSSRSTTPKPKPNNKGMEMLSIVDDFGEAEHHNLDKSYGYFSASMSGTDEGASPASTPSKSQRREAALRHTQDHSEMDVEEDDSLPLADPAGPFSDLAMEMYMMTRASTFMQKTSSPLSERRDHAQDAAAQRALAESGSDSYSKWRHYLQSTPTYVLHNVSRIPEAIAGHFSPSTIPAYIDTADMESAAKRYKVDVEVHAERCLPQQPAGVAVASTEL